MLLRRHHGRTTAPEPTPERSAEPSPEPKHAKRSAKRRVSLRRPVEAEDLDTEDAEDLL